MFFTWMIQYPAISSLVSVNGPSITVRLSPEKRMRAPCDVGFSPAPSSMMPALTISSLNLAMAPSSSSLGILPASESLLALTITMKRIGSLLVLPTGVRQDDERCGDESTPLVQILVGRAKPARHHLGGGRGATAFARPTGLLLWKILEIRL